MKHSLLTISFAALVTVSANAADRADLTKPLFVISERNVCESETELDAAIQGAPAKCEKSPMGNSPVVVLNLGSFPWQTAYFRFTRPPLAGIDGWVGVWDLSNQERVDIPAPPMFHE